MSHRNPQGTAGTEPDALGKVDDPLPSYADETGSGKTAHLPIDSEFERQKEAFQNIPHESLTGYLGEFVVSRDGEIIDHDSDLVRLGRRFFGQYGDIAVYIARVGDPIQVTIRTPFFK